MHQDGAAQVKRTDVMRFHASPAPRDALPFTAFRATIGRRNTVTTQRTLYTQYLTYVVLRFRQWATESSVTRGGRRSDRGLG